MRLPKDILTGNMTKPRLFLCETNKDRICQLETIEMSGSFKFNTYSELTFTVSRTYTNMITGETHVNPFYDQIEALRLVLLEGLGYFEIQDPEIVSDGIKEIKNVTAYSLEYTLSQKYLENFNINTGEIDSMEVIYANGGKINPITLYNPNEPGLSLLNLALEKIYGWRIGHVDASLYELGRTFEVSRQSVYDFITQDICEKFNCFAVFDTINNTINMYAEALSTKYVGDGNEKTFVISTPYASVGSVTVDGYKTTAYRYQIIESNDGVKTGIITFDEPPANGLMIEVIDGSQEQWTTDVYISFDNLAQEVNISSSADNIKTVLSIKGADDLDIREVNMGLPYLVDLSYYYSVDWMGQDLYDAYTLYLQNCNKGQTEYQENSRQILTIDGYVAYETNRLSLEYSIADNVTSTTVGTYYVQGGVAPNYYYTEVSLPDEWNANVEHYYMMSGSDLDETKFSNFYNALKVYYNSQTKKDVSELTKLKDDFAFMKNNSIDNLIANLSNANNLDAKDKAVLNFLDEMWDQIGLTPLKSLYYTPYENIKFANEEAKWNEPSNSNYWNYYPVTIVLNSLTKAIQDRESKIDRYKTEKKTLSNRNSEIANLALIDKNFTADQLIRLSSFLREDEYTDDNFVITDIDTIDTIMSVKKELMECGKIELFKLCSPKLEFSMDMANIYALPEFEPIINQFQLGNLINVAIRSDYVKRARLLQVDINFNDFSDFSCEFGELMNLRTPASIHADLLATALTAGKSVASNASYWNKASDTTTSLSILIQQGLLDAATVIKSIDGTQGVSIDQYGIHLQKIDPNTGATDPKEGWIVNNQFLYSDDNFKTTKSVFGEYVVDGRTHWGLLAEAVMAGYIAGCTIEGGTIDIGEGTFVVDSGGNVTMKAASIDGYVEKDGVISSINQSAENVTINANKISLAGKTIDLTSDNITIDSTNFSVTKDGKITANSGKIAGWSITDSNIYKTTTIDGKSYNVYMQASDNGGDYNAFCVRTKNEDVESWDTQFSVNYSGKLLAKNADITGTIIAQDGSIAGYNIGPGGSYSNALYKRVTGDGTGVDYEVGLKATGGDTDLAFYVKQSADDWATSSNVFYVNNSGKLYAKNAFITGEVNASSGSIANWTIGTNRIYVQNSDGTYNSINNSSGSLWAFIAGAGSLNDSTDAPFRVTHAGKLLASDAVIKGEITADSGSIGGWGITSTRLYSSSSASNTEANSLHRLVIASYHHDSTNHNAIILQSRTSTDNDWTTQFRVRYDGSVYMNNATITGNSTIASACIPNLSADKITSGTISTSRLSSSVITTDNFSSKTLSTGNLTVTGGATIGSWSVTTSGALTAVSGDVGVGLSAYGLSAGNNGSTPWVNILMAGQNASDQRLKKNIYELDNKLDQVFDNLKPVRFEYSTNNLSNGIHFGYLAQDVIKSFADEGENIDNYSLIYETATEDDPTEKYYQLNKAEFIALNTWQIQKLKARINELENRLAALEK